MERGWNFEVAKEKERRSSNIVLKLIHRQYTIGFLFKFTNSPDSLPNHWGCCCDKLILIVEDVLILHR